MSEKRVTFEQSYYAFTRSIDKADTVGELAILYTTRRVIRPNLVTVTK